MLDYKELFFVAVQHVAVQHVAVQHKPLLGQGRAAMGLYTGKYTPCACAAPIQF